MLLCVDTHSECGSICQVDAIVMLTWSKVCITKAITISITISIQKLSSTVNHTIQKLSFVENWSDSWKTGQIVELVKVPKSGQSAVPVHKSWPEEGGNGRED